MNKEYFTPDISDLHIGYKCETKVQPYPNWVNTKIIEGEDITFIQEGIWEVRTRYLTKEQIEAESWEFKDSFNYEDELREIFKKAEFIMEYNYKNNELLIRKGSWYPEETKYQGFCSSINEFKTICKFLKIKNEKL